MQGKRAELVLQLLKAGEAKLLKADGNFFELPPSGEGPHASGGRAPL